MVDKDVVLDMGGGKSVEKFFNIGFGFSRTEKSPSNSIPTLSVIAPSVRLQMKLKVTICLGMRRCELCDYCEAINFEVAGFHGPDFSESSMVYESDPHQLSQVLKDADTCFFCQKIAEAFDRWRRQMFSNSDDLDIERAEVDVGPYRLRSLEVDADGKHKGHLLRICVNITIRKPDPDPGFFSPDFFFQRYSDQARDVATLCDEPSLFHRGNEEPYSGRLRPLLVDTRLFCKWIENCKTSHGEQCGKIFTGSPPAWLRLIDVEQRCIAVKTGICSWVALSYVSGEVRLHMVTKATLPLLQQPGSLSSARLPAIIDDAINLTQSLGERYLWVNSLCIVQDDEADKSEFISQMGSIYGYASVTIIAGAGDSPDAGLPGFRRSSRRLTQTPFTIKGVSLVDALDPAGSDRTDSYLGDFAWYQQGSGWTFIERLFSRRVLIFTPEQVYWECQKASWCEDSFWEAPESPTIYRHSFSDEDFRQPWVTDLDDFERVYRKLVEEYSKRNKEDNSLDAFAGVLRAFERCTGHTFLWGLPASLLGTALSWPCERNGVRRRSEPCILRLSDGTHTLCPFPSWSWVGWVGQINLGQLFGTLFSRTPGFVFYRLDSTGQPREIPQEQRVRHLTSRRKMIPSESMPFPWKDESRTVVAASDIPPIVFTRHIAPAILCFWSSTAILMVQHGMGKYFGFPVPLVSHKGKEISGIWTHKPESETGKEEMAKFIVIARDSLEYCRPEDQLALLYTSCEDGVTYRRGQISINESDWTALDNRSWELVFLA